MNFVVVLVVTKAGFLRVSLTVVEGGILELLCKGFVMIECAFGQRT